MSEKPQAGDYTVEYSKSNRSTCKLTSKTIKKDALRIGKIVQSQSFDGTFPMWYNFDDWEKDKKLVKEFQTKCKTVHGLSKIRLEHQERIKKLMGQSSDDAAASSSDSNLTEDQKQKKKEFEEENKQIWELKDKLKKLTSRDLRAMLSENDQIEKGGEDLLIDRCALGLMFGNMPACPHDECEDGYMTYSGNVFKCHGKLPWAKCDYSLTVDEAFEKATDWILPDDIAESEYFEDFEFKKHKKCNFALDTSVRSTAATSSSEEKKDEEKEEIDPEKEKLPLGNFKIACSGKLSMKQSELQEIIEENGATFMKDVASDCTHLVCSETEYDKETTKVKKAKKQGVLILDEDWIHMSVEKERKLTDDERKEYIHYDPKDKKRKKNDDETKEEGGAGGEGESVPKKKKVTIKGRAAVDEDCEDADILHVYEKGDNVFSVHLNLTDLSTGANSYYVIQLLEHDTRKMYYVFRKWGRLNTNIGSNKLTEYGSDLESAKTEFKNTYLDKTGNSWSERHNFQKRPGKFLPIDVDYGDDATDLDKLQSDMKKDYHGKLHPEIANLVKLIFDVQSMKRTLKEIEIDTEKLPLGKLKKAHISKGYEVLTEIQNLIKLVRGKEKEAGVFMEDDPPTTSSLDATTTVDSSTTSSSVGDDNTTQSSSVVDAATTTTPTAVVEKPKKPKTEIHQQSKQQFLTLSNKFYTIIPTSNPEIIDDEDLLGAKVKMIEALQEMEIATSLLKNDDDSEEDPLDGYYKKLKTQLQPLGKDSDMFKTVNTYLQNTHASTHRAYGLELLDAFEVDREGEGERFKKYEDLHNRRLLWHGSRVSNFCGILSQGLRIAPPEAPVTGYMFGKGIYFADMSSKSANYCNTSPDQNVGILLLCDVACGNLYERLQADYIEKLPKGYHCCFGHGRTEPNDTMAQHILDGKVMVPLGTPTNSKVPRQASLLYNEFIVYDVEQVKIRYLLKVKFNYNNRR